MFYINAFRFANNWVNLKKIIWGLLKKSINNDYNKKTNRKINMKEFIKLLEFQLIKHEQVQYSYKPLSLLFVFS